MQDDTTTISELKSAMGAFVAARDWERFHQPKNLAMSIAIEAAELMEHFQWETPELGAERKAAIGEEVADVLAYVLSLANVLDLDLAAISAAKMEKNAAKYPSERERAKKTWS
ncbi:MAG: nucleotide pyrophosphohydrolase [Planctomycetes bacterium]|nr:nucleotide pyrophosphohydrolase [Planctomycetota bacterium]